MKKTQKYKKKLKSKIKKGYKKHSKKKYSKRKIGGKVDCGENEFENTNGGCTKSGFSFCGEETYDPNQYECVPDNNGKYTLAPYETHNPATPLIK